MDIRVVSAPVISVVVGFGDHRFRIDYGDRRHEVSGFAAGFVAAHMRLQCARTECVEIRMSPLQAYALLPVPPAELSSDVVTLDALWGERAGRLSEALAGAQTWQQRFAWARAVLVAPAHPVRSPDPEVIASWSGIVARRGQVRIADLAAACGWSRKRLWARFEAQTGLTPKRAAMLVRLRHAINQLVAGRSAADVAARCGYSDQAHLCRDVSRFAGITPGAITTATFSSLATRRHRAWQNIRPRPGIASR